MTVAATHRPIACRTARRPARLAAAIVLALGLAIADSALAQENASAPSTVICTVSGYDVIIHNKGADPLPSGAVVLWSVPFARMDGSHMLAVALEPGGRVFLSGALGSNFLGPKLECAASLDAQTTQPSADGDAEVPPPQT